jgi:predicted nucleic acid-binding protein
MPIDRVVINASPLITLFRAGLEPLLPKLFPELLVPDSVWSEVVSQAHDDPAARGLPIASWARRTSVTLAPQVQLWGLGAGETSVLSFAMRKPGYTAVLDDRAARRCARVLRIPVIGTAGIVVLAKRRGFIGSVEEALMCLQGAGLWLSERLVEKLVDECDRAP